MSSLVESGQNTIGENLRRYRLIKGMTQDELAEGLCSISQLSKLENGKTQLKPALLKTFAERLGVTLEQLATADYLLVEMQETLQLGRDAFSAGNFEKAFEFAREVIHASRECGYQQLLIEGILLQCRLLLRTGRYASAIERIEQAFAEELEMDAKQKVELWIELGHAYKANGDMRRAFDFYCRADEEFESFAGKNESHLRIFYALADCHYFMHNTRTALRYIEKAEQLAKELSKHLVRIRAVYYKATMLKRLGEPEKAKAIFLTTLKEAQDNNLLLDVGLINNNLGWLYKDEGDYGKANVHLQRALQVYELLGQEYYKCDSYFNLAEIALMQGEIAKCKGYAHDVGEVLDRMGGNRYVEKAKTLQIRSWICKAEGNHAEYVQLLDEVMRIYEQHNVVINAYEVAVELGDALYGQDDAQAVEAYRKAVEFHALSQSYGFRR